MNRPEQVQEEELTLKELILKIQEYIYELLRNWWIIALACIVSLSFFLYKHYTADFTYGATLKFVIEGQSGSGGGLSNLLGSIGLNKGGGKTNPYKILEVATGTELFIKVLDTEVDGELIGNKLLDAYELPQKWAKNNAQYQDFRFTKVGDLDNSDIQKQRIIKKLHRFVVGSQVDRTEALTRMTLDEDTGIYTLKSATVDESLTLALTNRYYEEIKFFFEEEVFANQRQIAEILDEKADSLKQLRDDKVRELARFEDRNRAIIGRDVIAQRAIMTMEHHIINEAYAKIFAQREMTDINRKDLKPLFVAIDRPFKPLSPAGTSLFKNVLSGLVLGVFLSCLFLIVRKMYRDIMYN